MKLQSINLKIWLKSLFVILLIAVSVSVFIPKTAHGLSASGSCGGWGEQCAGLNESNCDAGFGCFWSPDTSGGAVSEDGKCGTAATTYPASSTSFGSDYLCFYSKTTPTASFPAAGSSVSWSCRGFGAGNNATCTAFREEFGTNPSCLINSFTADNSNPAYNTGTTLRFSLSDSFPWNISLLNGSVVPNPSSGTGTNGTSTTGNLTQNHIYKLTCGTATSVVTVVPRKSTQIGTIIVKVVDQDNNPLTTSWCMDATLDSNDFGDTSTGGTFTKPINAYRPCAIPLAGYTGPVFNPSEDYWELTDKATLIFNIIYTRIGGGPTCAPTHYNCNAGSSTNQSADSTKWTWSCGSTSCSEDKAASTNGEISATSCEIPANASTCVSLVNWNTRNLTSGATEVTRNNPAGTHVSYDTSGSNAALTIRYGVVGTTDFFLIHNINGTPTTLAQSIATASCAPRTIWDGTICRPDNRMSGTLTPENPSCAIALNRSSCSMRFSWRVTNPEVPGGSAVTTDPSLTLATGDEGTGSFVVQYDSKDFYLYNNAIRLATSTVGANCTSGTEWNGVRCIDIDDGECRNGATNFPQCTTGPGPGSPCLNGATNPPTCTTGPGPGSPCLNGATNPPVCTIDSGGTCVNGAVNPTLCTIDGGGSCLNRTYNPPLCTQTRKPTFIED